MLTANDLSQFTGTESYHRLGLLPSVVATDGVAFLAKQGKLFWLTDAIASYQVEKKVAKEFFQVWTLTKQGSGAILIATDGNNKALAKQVFEYAESPLQEIKIFVQDGEVAGKRVKVMMLPSEY